MSKKEEMLKEQILKVILILKKRLEKEPDRLILNTLYERYTKAMLILVDGGNLRKIMIRGGCKAYLDSFSDYMNPMLLEMDKAEELLQEILDSK